jgi:hypothetical protein
MPCPLFLAPTLCNRFSSVSFPLHIHALALSAQHSYEGLLDELFEIKNNTVSVDADVFSTGGAQQKGGAEKANPAAASAGTAAGNKRKLPLNSADILFSEIRDLNFAVLGPHLHMRASQVWGGRVGLDIDICVMHLSLLIMYFLFIHKFISRYSFIYLSINLLFAVLS